MLELVTIFSLYTDIVSVMPLTAEVAELDLSEYSFCVIPKETSRIMRLVVCKLWEEGLLLRVERI